MSEEEKEAIEDIDLLVHCLNYGEMKMTIASERQKEIAQELQILLNLLNKQQKEIEELKQNRDDYKEEYIKLQNARYYNYISKDKIKEIFQFYIERDSLFNDNPHKMAVIRLKDVLEELLEEN